MCYSTSTSVRKQLEEFLGPEYALGGYEAFWAASGFDFPTLPVLTCDKPFVVQMLQWGLIPTWAKNRESALQIRAKTLNARSETIFETASFRDAVSGQRCLVLVDGFFEWQHHGKTTQPYYVHLPGATPFAMGGIHSMWTDRETGEMTDSFSIITTVANKLMSDIHNLKKRMPLILDKDQWSAWLDPALTREQITAMMTPYPDGILEAYPVSKLISSRLKNFNVPEVQKRIDLVKPGLLDF